MITQEPPRLTDTELRAIAKLVYEKSGIVLHEGKRELITSRLQKRLRHLGLASYGAYLKMVADDASGAELVTLLDSIATNHTHFFREAKHFELLTARVLASAAFAQGRELRGWCAACSTGEEPYTILMSLLEAGVPRVKLLASDMSTKALATARQGVYRLERMQEVQQAGDARRWIPDAHGDAAAEGMGHDRTARLVGDGELADADDELARRPGHEQRGGHQAALRWNAAGAMVVRPCVMPLRLSECAMNR